MTFDSADHPNSSFVSFGLPPRPRPNASHINDSLCAEVTILKLFDEYYGDVHGYLSIAICLFGLLSNIFNVIVLNQKMLISSTNMLLTSLAISDAILLFLYIPFSGYFLIGKHLLSSSYAWSLFMLVYVSAQNLLHSASSNLVVTVACFRVIYIRYLVRCRQLCSRERTHLAIFIVFVISGLLTIPCLAAHHIVPAADGEPDRYMVTYVDDSSALSLYMYWNTAVFLKLLPIVCLTLLSIIIISRIQEQKQRFLSGTLHATSNLLRSSGPGEYNRTSIKLDDGAGAGRISKELNTQSSCTSPDLVTSRSAKAVAREKADIRMTLLLLAVIFIYIIALVPQAVLLLLNGGLGHCFQQEVYSRLGNLTDLLTITSTSINFILYCSMSRQFRVTFLRLFLPCVYRRSKHWSTQVQAQANKTSLVF